MNKGKKVDAAAKLNAKNVDAAIDEAIGSAYTVSTTARDRVAKVVQELAAKIHADLPKLAPDQVAQMIIDRVALFLESIDKGKRGSFRTQVNEGLRAVNVAGWAEKGLRIRAAGAGRKALTFAQKVAKGDQLALEGIAEAKDDTEKVARAIAAIGSAGERIRAIIRTVDADEVRKAMHEELEKFAELVK